MAPPSAPKEPSPTPNTATATLPEPTELQRRLDLVRRISHTSIYVFDLTTLEVEWVNHHVGGLLGYDQADLEAIGGAFIRAHLHPDDSARLPGLLERWRSEPDDAVLETEYRLRHKDGTWRTFFARDTIYERGPDMVPTRLIGTTVDVTERRELQRLATRADKLDAVARMAGGVAHDFNNLLTVVLGGVALARSALARGKDPTAHLDALQKAAEHAATISRRLMGLAREVPGSAEVLDLRQFLHDQQPMLTRLVGASHVDGRMPNLVLDLADAWPIRIDPALLTQALVALIARADEYGEVRLELGRATEADGHGVTRLQVVGRSPPDFQASAASGVRALDLETVAGLVAQHHGRLDVARAEGGHQAVRLTFPAVFGADAPPPRPGPTKAEPAHLVVVAEDEPMVADLTRRILVHAGHRVLVCRDGQEALECIREQPRDVALLISDIVMPRLSGLELVSQLSRELPTLPVLLASGYPEDERRLNDPVLARVAFLPKPFRAADLLRAVSRLLEHRAEAGPAASA